MRASQLWAAVAVALGVTVAACSGGSTVPTAGAADDDRRRRIFVGRRRRWPRPWPTRSACAATVCRTSLTRW